MSSLMWSLFWLRVAAILYSLGLIQTLFVLFRRGQNLFEPVRVAFSIGVIFHFVSLVERGFVVGHLPAENFYETLSLCAYLLALTYLVIAKWYKFPALSVAAFPAVFLLTAVAATEVPMSGWADQRLRNAWLISHVLLIVAGLVSMVLATTAALFYLLQERHLKRKQTGGLFSNLPPLGTLDSLTSKAMSIGFILVTIGFFAAWVWAFIESGNRWLSEPKVHISLLTWLFYLLMMYLRVVAGWRGRRAAFLAIYVLLFSALTLLSHSGLRPLLER